MVIVLLLAITLGGLLATVVPFVVFVAALVLLVALALLSALAGQMPLGQALGWSVALFTLTQIGYGLGAGIVAYLRTLRSDSPTARKRPLPWIGRQP